MQIKGLTNAAVGEIFVVQGKHNSYGQVNVARQNTDLFIGGILIDPSIRISLGNYVETTRTFPTVFVSDSLIGSFLSPLAEYLFTPNGFEETTDSWLIEAPAPSIIQRQSIFEALHTVIFCLDAMIPIGRGQRELILGDRQTGKTSLGMDTIINQQYENVYCIYVPVGQKASSVLQIFQTLASRNCMAYSSILMASASLSPLQQFLSVYTGNAIAEFFMIQRDLPCFVVFDDLAKHAVSYREIYLLLRRPPGREAYPGEIFYVHSRLLERSAKLLHDGSLGGGSVTSFPIIETQAGDISSYITTNVISITDGQIFLDRPTFLAGQLPAINIGQSVTRVGSSAQEANFKALAAGLKMRVAQYKDKQAFGKLSGGSDLNAETQLILDFGARLIEMTKQVNGRPYSASDILLLASIAESETLLQFKVESITRLITAITTFNSLYPSLTYLLSAETLVTALYLEL